MCNVSCALSVLNCHSEFSDNYHWLFQVCQNTISSRISDPGEPQGSLQPGLRGDPGTGFKRSGEGSPASLCTSTDTEQTPFFSLCTSGFWPEDFGKKGEASKVKYTECVCGWGMEPVSAKWSSTAVHWFFKAPGLCGVKHWAKRGPVAGRTTQALVWRGMKSCDRISFRKWRCCKCTQALAGPKGCSSSHPGVPLFYVQLSQPRSSVCQAPLAGFTRRNPLWVFQRAATAVVPAWTRRLCGLPDNCLLFNIIFTGFSLDPKEFLTITWDFYPFG